MKYPFTVSIDEAISGLIYRLISAEANQSTSIIFNINWQYRLMSSMSTLREICLYKTFEEEKIKDNEILVIMSPETIKFSPIMKSSHIYLENKRKLASKMDTDDIEFCLAEPGFKYGRRYIEFILESEPIERNIIIGVTNYRANYEFNESKNFYGFMLSECKIVFNINNKMELCDYGIPTKIGDKIGMMIELSKNEREVCYFINGEPVGIAFRDLPLEKLYPCVCLGFPGTKVQVNSKVNFPVN